MQLTSHHLRAPALLTAGVLMFADDIAVVWAGFIATAGMLFTIGFVEARLRAVFWASTLVASAFVADVLWQIEWAPFDRAGQYEPIPQTPFVLIALPVPMTVIAVGVAVGALWRRIRSRPRPS